MVGSVPGKRAPGSRGAISFIGIGFGRNPNAPHEYLGFEMVVSNALDENFKWLDRARDTTRASHREFESTSPLHVCPPIGQTVPKAMLVEMNGLLLRAIENNSPPAKLAQILGRTIRRFSFSRKRSKVGTDLLSVIIPRQRHNTDLKFFTRLGLHKPDPSDPVCYLTTIRNPQPKWTLPNFAAGGWAVSDISLEQVQDGETSEMMVHASGPEPLRWNWSTADNSVTASAIIEMADDGKPTFRFEMVSIPLNRYHSLVETVDAANET